MNNKKVFYIASVIFLLNFLILIGPNSNLELDVLLIHLFINIFTISIIIFSFLNKLSGVSLFVLSLFNSGSLLVTLLGLSFFGEYDYTIFYWFLAVILNIYLVIFSVKEIKK